MFERSISHQINQLIQDSQWSLPTRKLLLGQTGVVNSGGSFDLSSIHSSEAGGSMLVLRLAREIITEEMVDHYVEKILERYEVFLC